MFSIFDFNLSIYKRNSSTIGLAAIVEQILACGAESKSCLQIANGMAINVSVPNCLRGWTVLSVVDYAEESCPEAGGNQHWNSQRCFKKTFGLELHLKTSVSPYMAETQTDAHLSN